NPTVQNLRRTGFLPAKVVNEVNAIVGFELKWSIVYFGDGVVAQIEHADAQLSARDDKRPAAANPAADVRGLDADRRSGYFGWFVCLMVDRIEHFDDHSLKLDGVRHIDWRAIHAKQRFGEVRLAVAGLTVHQERFSGVHRRSNLRQHVRTD